MVAVGFLDQSPEICSKETLCCHDWGLTRYGVWWGLMSGKVVAVVAFASLAVGLAACANTGPKEAGGTAAGAVAGGVIGNLVGGSAGNRLAGTVIGATVGGLIGNRVGASLDDEDRRRAYAAQMQALDTGPSGAPVAWRNPDDGRYGNVVPGPAYQANGATCRQYTETIYIDGRPQTARGTACRNPDGTWTAVE
jgi:surface antigen